MSIYHHSTVSEAIDQLLDTGVSGLPVVGDNLQLVGIVSEFALLAVAYDMDVLKDSVSKHMTKNVMTVEATDSIKKVADLFILHRIRRLPVMSSGSLVGIITRRDVLRSVRSVGHELNQCSPSEALAHAT